MSYEAGDKVIVEISRHDAEELNLEDDIYPDYEQVLGKLEDFQPKQEKIKFTPEMKEEFDEARAKFCTPFQLFNFMDKNRESFTNLFEFLNEGVTSLKDYQKQLNFYRIWNKNSLIEVVKPEQHAVKLGEQYLFSRQNKTFGFVYHASELKLTLDEVKEAEEQLGIQGLQAKWKEASEKDE